MQILFQGSVTVLYTVQPRNGQSYLMEAPVSLICHRAVTYSLRRGLHRSAFHASRQRVH